MIYIEKKALNLPLSKLIIESGKRFDVIESYEVVEDKKTNIIVNSKYDNFVHACPATNIYRCCNYHVVDIMQGCPFDCAYCILQAYLPHKCIKVTADVNAVENAILESIKHNKRRIGSGELSDSLALDNIIPLSKYLVPIANANDNIQFEFKTKSANVENLLNLNPRNVLISWSLNPQNIIDSEEPSTANLDQRLKAAEMCVKHGYKIGFHFDPLIYHNGFEQNYGALIERLHDTFNEKDIEYISVSTFRSPPDLIDEMRLRPTQTNIIKGDFVRGIDGKVRYFKPLRVHMLRFVIDKLKTEWHKPFIYLCMEHNTVWQSLFNFDPNDRENFEKLFPCYQKTENL